MLFLRHSPRWAYLAAVLGSGLVLAIDAVTRGSVQVFLGTITFTFTVLAAASLGGWKPGVLAMVLSIAGFVFFIVPPGYTFRIPHPVNLLPLGGITAAGAVLIVLCEWLHAAGARLEARQRRLELEIDERRQALRALEEAESRARSESIRYRETAGLLRVTLASIGDGVIATDADGRVTFLNPLAEALTGWTQEEAMSRPLSEVFRIVNEWTRAPVESPCAKVLQTGSIVELANHSLLIGKNGKEIPIDDSAAPICNEVGKVLGVVLVFRDATRERAATDALQRLAAIVEHCNDAVIGKSLDGIIMSWNAAAERLYGYTAEEAIGQSISLIVPADRQAELDQMTERLKHGEPVRPLETVRVRKDGSRVDISLAVSSLKNSHGEVVGVAKIARDISDAKRARDAIESNEKQLNDFFENSPIPLQWIGADGRVFRANQAQVDLLGYSKAELIGRHVAELHADRETISEILACLARHETIQSYEARLRCKDGEFKDVLIDSNVYTEHGEIVHTRCFTRDITDRKRAAQNLHFLVDASESLGVLTDVATSMRKLARRAVNSFADWCVVRLVSENKAIEPVAYAHGDRGCEAQLSEYLERYPLRWESLSLYSEVLRGGRAELFSDVAGPGFAGAVGEDRRRVLVEELRTRSLIVVPLQGRGRILGALTLARSDAMSQFNFDDLQIAVDLGKRAANAIENYRLFNELRIADRQKDDFVAMLAHELRNPLAAISYAAQLMAVSPEDSDSALAIVGRQVAQLSTLINDLLDVSRITRGKIQLKKEGIDAKTLVERALGTTQPLLHEHAHTVTREIAPDDLPLFVDPTRVEQILVNLITNAAKYTPKGGQITVRAFREEEQVMMRVKDTGIGIPPDMIGRVFELFTQVNPSIDRSQGGLGIGLSIVRRLVEMHGGSVSVASDGAGKGSEFTVRLPMARLRDSAAATPLAAKVILAGLRVLVVDDNVDTATTVSVLLKKIGCVVETAHDGLAALERAQSLRPDVAVLDIGLPGLDGFEVAKRIRANPEFARMKLIAVSGYGQDQDRSRAKDAGFDHHMVKPVLFDSLSAVLAE